jgi:hypothetical protein
MNWKDCVIINEQYGVRTRFDWPVGPGKSGFDCNENSTFSDLWGGLSWIWTWPGDYLMNSPSWREFFEIGNELVVASNFSIAFGWIVFSIVCVIFSRE